MFCFCIHVLAFVCLPVNIGVLTIFAIDWLENITCLVSPTNQDQHESAAAILQIKENMQQDVKRFETSESEVTASTDDFSFMT